MDSYLKMVGGWLEFGKHGLGPWLGGLDRCGGRGRGGAQGGQRGGAWPRRWGGEVYLAAKSFVCGAGIKIVSAANLGCVTGARVTMVTF